jgi:hypothetical protein
MADWVFREGFDVSWEHCGRSAFWEGADVVCSKCQEVMSDLVGRCGHVVVICPNGEGDPFACHSFCSLCEGFGEFCQTCEGGES